VGTGATSCRSMVYRSRRPLSSSKMNLSVFVFRLCNGAGPHPVTKVPPPLMGFWVPQSFTSRGAHTPIGFRVSPLAVFTASRLTTPRPRPLSLTKATVLSRTSTPLQSFTPLLHIDTIDRLTHLAMRTTAKSCYATFRGFFPFSVYSWSEPQISRPFPRTCPVTPLGFLNPSMFYSPISLPSLFHPGTTLGIRSSRPYSPPGAVCPLGPRSPHDVFAHAFLTRTNPRDSNVPPRLQGLVHLTEHAKAALVIHLHNPRCLRELSLL
jgi:hypothetical protein